MTGYCAEEPWPAPDSALLVEETVTIAVQVNGKRRDELTIARDAAKEDIEAAALKLDNVVRAIGGRQNQEGRDRAAEDRQCGGVACPAR